MRLVCVVEELLTKHISVREFAARVGMDERSAANFRDKNYQWSLKRKQLERLTKLAYEYGYDGIFEVRHHPLWSTFKKSDALIYRGDPVSDAEIEGELKRFLDHLQSQPKAVITHDRTKDGIKKIAKAMREKNCVFIGSPKYNPGTEIALSLLWSATPFDVSPANRRELPVQMIVPSGDIEETAILTFGAKTGFRFPAHGFVRVSWRPPEEYNQWEGPGQDAGVVVVCTSPLGTDNKVTTIIVFGYTGMATHETARQLMLGDPPVTESDLETPGARHLMAYSYAFKKIKASRTHIGEQRRVDEESRLWAPPWDQVIDR